MTIVDRVKNILIAPKTEWPVIAGETATVQSLYTGYILILAAIGPDRARLALRHCRHRHRPRAGELPPQLS